MSFYDFKLYFKGARELVNRIENDSHRSGATLIRDHVIDLFLDYENFPDKEKVKKFLRKNLRTKSYEVGQVPRLCSEGDVGRGVDKAYQKLENETVRVVG